MASVARWADIASTVALRVPTKEQMATAVQLLPAAMQPVGWIGHSGPVTRWQAPRYNEGVRTMLTISAGSVRVSRRHPGAADAARERAIERRIRDVDAEVRSRFNDDMSELAEPGDGLGGNSTVVTSWSRRSRARMKLTLDSLDYSPLFESGLEPAMITLTMPGEGWEACVPTPRAFKDKVKYFGQVFQRRWGVPLRGVWKMEFQRRGAPHLHVLMTPPTEDLAGFREWLSLSWAAVVGATGEARENHVKAGTSVELVGARYRDPRRIAAYFTKHGVFSAKEYQNQLPQIWLDAIAAGEHSAQFWGRWGLEKAEATVELNERPIRRLLTDETGSVDFVGVIADVTKHYRQYDEAGCRWATDASVLRAAARSASPGAVSDAVLVERYLRKLSRSLAVGRDHNGIIRDEIDKAGRRRPVKHVRVIRYDKLDRATGELIPVKEHRIGYYHGGSGFLSVNDGRQTAAALLRLLEQRRHYDLAG